MTWRLIADSAGRCTRGRLVNEHLACDGALVSAFMPAPVTNTRVWALPSVATSKPKAVRGNPRSFSLNDPLGDRFADGVGLVFLDVVFALADTHVFEIGDFGPKPVDILLSDQPTGFCP